MLVQHLEAFIAPPNSRQISPPLLVYHHKTGFAFWPPAFHLAPAECLCCQTCCPDSLFSESPRSLLQISALCNNDLSNLVAATWAEMLSTQRNKQTNHNCGGRGQGTFLASSCTTAQLIRLQRHDRKEPAHTPFLVFVRCEGSTTSLFVDHNTDVADLKAGLATRTGKSASCNASDHTGVTAVPVRIPCDVDLCYSPSLCRRASRASAIDLLW